MSFDNIYYKSKKMVRDKSARTKTITMPKWYDGWSIRIELLAKNKRNVRITVPNSGSVDGKIMTFTDIDVNSQLFSLIDLVDSALTQLSKPACRDVVDMHNYEKGR